MDDLVAFFAADLPASWTPPVESYENVSVEMVGYVLKDLLSFLTAAPQAECAHMVGLKTAFNIDGKEHKFNFELALGTQGRFKLTGNFPEVGYAGLGRGEAPWMIGGQKRVFSGTRSSDADLTLASLIAPEALLRYRMALGLAAGASLSPDLIKNYADFRVEAGPDNTRVLCVTGTKKKSRGDLRLTFDGAGRYPLAAEWDVEGVKGRIDFTHWQVNAASDNSVFEPPENLEKQDVLQRDVLQMFASIFQFAVEYFE
jgi:hypothetical protein